MDLRSFTEAKQQGYRVEFDLVDKMFRVFAHDGELITEAKETQANSSQMWEAAVSHMAARKGKER